MDTVANNINIQDHHVSRSQTQEYDAVLKDVQARWDEYNEEYDELFYACLDAIFCSPCDLYKNMYASKELLDKDRGQANELIKYRYAWRLLGLLLKYHEVENEYEIGIESVESIINTAKNILDTKSNDTYYKIGQTILDILDTREDELVQKIVLYLQYREPQSNDKVNKY